MTISSQRAGSASVSPFNFGINSLGENDTQNINRALLRNFRSGLDTLELGQVYELQEYDVVRRLDVQRNAEREQGIAL